MVACASVGFVIFTIVYLIRTSECNEDPQIVISNSNDTHLVLSPGESLDLLCTLPSSGGNVNVLPGHSLTPEQPSLQWQVVSLSNHTNVLYSQRTEQVTQITSSYPRRSTYIITSGSNPASARFFIQNVTFEDTAVYECHGRAKMQMVTVRVVNVTGSTALVSTREELVPVWKEHFNLTRFNQTEVSVDCTCQISPELFKAATVSWEGPFGSYDDYVKETRNETLSLIHSVLTLPLDISKPTVFANHTCFCGFVRNVGRSATAVVSIQPIFISRESPKKARSGEPAEVTCSAIANPPVNTFQWFKVSNGQKEAIEVPSNSKTVISSDEHSNHTETLRLSPSTDSDRGVYICSVQNELGKAEYHQGLRVRGQWATVWPFLGITVEVCIMATLIILYEKKRKQQQRRVSTLDDVDEANATAPGDGGATTSSHHAYSSSSPAGPSGGARYHPVPTKESRAVVNPALSASPVHQSRPQHSSQQAQPSSSSSSTTYQAQFHSPPQQQHQQQQASSSSSYSPHQYPSTSSSVPPSNPPRPPPPRTGSTSSQGESMSSNPRRQAPLPPSNNVSSPRGSIPSVTAPAPPPPRNNNVDTGMNSQHVRQRPLVT